MAVIFALGRHSMSEPEQRASDAQIPIIADINSLPIESQQKVLAGLVEAAREAIRTGSTELLEKYLARVQASVTIRHDPYFDKFVTEVLSESKPQPERTSASDLASVLGG
jgi:hypothetical protein